TYPFLKKDFPKKTSFSMRCHSLSRVQLPKFFMLLHDCYVISVTTYPELCAGSLFCIALGRTSYLLSMRKMAHRKSTVITLNCTAVRTMRRAIVWASRLTRTTGRLEKRRGCNERDDFGGKGRSNRPG